MSPRKNRIAHDELLAFLYLYFDVRVTKKDAASCVTSSAATDMLCTKLDIVGDPNDRPLQANRIVRDAVSRAMDGSINTIGQDLLLEAIFPSNERRQRWESLGVTLYGRTLSLRRPRVLFWSMLVTTVTVSTVLAISLPGVNPMWGIPILTIVVWILANLLTPSLRIEFPWQMKTVGALVRKTEELPLRFNGQGVPWSRQQVLGVVLQAAKSKYRWEEITQDTPLPAG